MFNNALLKERRKIKGLTQYDASKIVGVARTTYADYENGKIQPPIDKIHRICEWLDLPLEQIMQIENNTGVELSRFKTKNRMTDAEKIQTINRIKKQADTLNTFDDSAMIVRKMNIEVQEKEIVLNLLDNTMQKYMLNPSDMEIYDRIEKKKKND